ncbi:hypothetical protein BS78_08G141000 [Paspalum vaginatum]|nr:hypothetical protein BS78_08G141000 [Paspalum vaginatum]
MIIVVFFTFTRFPPHQPLCFLLLSTLLCHLPSASPSLSTVCTHGAAPVHLPDPLAFCGIAGLSCCDAAADAALREEFHRAMNVVPAESDAARASIIANKAILCTACMPASTSPPQPPVNNAATTIRSKSIPFPDPVPPQCAAASSSPPPSSSSAPAQPHQDDADASSLLLLCLERLDAAGTYLGMAALPDGSGRALLYTHDSSIWLASVPTAGSGAALQVDDDDAPFLDLSDRALRITGLALHPRFATNGRLFVSYVRRASAITGAAAGNGSRHHQLVLEEFSATAKHGVHYHGMASRAAPGETRRILFTTGLPQDMDMNPSNHQPRAYGGGQILTMMGRRPGGHDRSSDLYLVTGYGGGDEATSNKNISSPFLGKIVRFNIDDDGMAAKGTTEEPDVFVTGLSDPRGCSFDSERPTDLYCAGVDHEQRKEQVYLISSQASSAKAAAVSLIISHGRLATGGPSSIIGGLVYRGSADPLLHGRYLYIYGSAVWAAADTTTAISSGALYMYASGKILNAMCSANSPVPCGGGGAIDGIIISLGQDSSNDDVFFVATGGIYRVIPPALCAAAAARRRRRHAAPPPVPAPQQMPSWLKWWAGSIGLPAMLVIWSGFFCYCPRLFFGRGGSSQPAATTSYYNNCMCNCCCVLPAVYVTNNNYGATTT